MNDTVEKHDIEYVLSCFLDNCEVEVFGIYFGGKDRLRKTLNCLYEMIGENKFDSTVIIVNGDVFFEEFILNG